MNKLFSSIKTEKQNPATELEQNLKQVKIKNTKLQIFRIVLTGILLAIAVGTSMFELRIPIMGAEMPMRVFDVLIIVFAIPIIGIWYTLAIAIIEPWLHLAFDSDHPPIQMVFDNATNIILVLAFALIFYKLFDLNNTKDLSTKQAYFKRTAAGLILIPLSAVVSTLAFVLTLVVLNNTSLTKPDEYIQSIADFYKSWASIFFILLGIEMARFLIVYILFALVQKRIGQLSQFSY